MRLADGVRTGDVETRLRAAGYEDDDGLLASDATEDAITAELTPELAFVYLDAGDGIVITGDTSAAVHAAVDAAEAADSEPVPDDVVAAVAGTISATLSSGDDVCGRLAMSAADPAEQSEADSLLAQAGDINPLTGFGIGELPGGQVLVAMGFEDEDQARTNADTRAVLAAGPAPGQGGDFADRFTVNEVSADGDVVTMRLTPVDGAYVVSDLSDGPVLFATC